MKIWRLTTPHSSGYPFVRTEDEVQYYLQIFSQFYQENTVATQWQPTLVCGLHEADIGRIVLSNQEHWVITEKARNILAPLINPAVEYLPLIDKKNIVQKISRYQQLRQRKTYKPIIETIHPEKQYLLNILDIKTSEIIDFKQSEFEYDEKDDTIYMIDKLAFQPEKIQNAHLFKIQNPGIYFRSATFISDEFRKIIKQHQLTGLTFSELPEDDGGNLIWQNE